MKDEWLKNFFTVIIILAVAMITLSLVGCSVEGYNLLNKMQIQVL